MKSILFPLTVLVAWTMVIWFWMYATRLPAIFKAKMRLNRYAPRGEQMNELPPEVRWKADNYNHLMEQPTIFYGIGIVLYLLSPHDGPSIALAWGYVSLRIVHSLIQVTVNVIPWRFFAFTASSFCLVGLIVRAFWLL